MTIASLPDELAVAVSHAARRAVAGVAARAPSVLLLFVLREVDGADALGRSEHLGERDGAFEVDHASDLVVGSR